MLDVVEAGIEIPSVADGVFPESLLTDTPFPLVPAPLREPFRPMRFRGKRSLDQTPAGGKVRVAGGQGPEAMEVVGQNHYGADIERPFRSHRAESRPERVDVFGQQPTAPFQQRHREEIG
jgi:hypothetical protein